MEIRKQGVLWAAECMKRGLLWLCMLCLHYPIHGELPASNKLLPWLRAPWVTTVLCRFFVTVAVRHACRSLGGGASQACILHPGRHFHDAFRKLTYVLQTSVNFGWNTELGWNTFGEDMSYSGGRNCQAETHIQAAWLLTAPFLRKLA